MLNKLQEALNTELRVSQHYLARHLYWKNLNAEKLAEAYKLESVEEQGHATLVADRMQMLGGVPELNPGREPPVAGTLRGQYEEDLGLENQVVRFYLKLVSDAASVGDYTTEDILRRILRESEDHAHSLSVEIEKCKLIGDDLWTANWLR